MTIFLFSHVTKSGFLAKRPIIYIIEIQTMSFLILSHAIYSISPIYRRKNAAISFLTRYKCTLTKSEDPGKEKNHNLKSSTFDPLKHQMDYPILIVSIRLGKSVIMNTAKK